MSEKRRGLGKGLGALIPAATTGGRPIDVFFPEQPAPSQDEGKSAEQAQPQQTTRIRTDTPARIEPDSSSSADKNATLTHTPKASGTKAATPATTHTSPSATATKAPPNSRQASAKTDVDKGAKPAPNSANTSKAGTTRTTSSDSSDTTTAGSNGETEDLVAVPGAVFAEIPVTSVVANRRQPRQTFDEDELAELAASIREVGVLQPVVVRRLDHDDEAAFELIMGERRLRAAQLADQEAIPAIVRDVDDNSLLRDALLENLHRTQLNPLEEAAAYQQLLDDFDCTQEELAGRIARSRPQISNTLRLLKLPGPVQRRVAASVLSAGHARALLGLTDPAAMERLAQRIVAEGLSVRATEEVITLGEEPMEPELRRRPRRGEHTEGLDRLATRLADRFDTRVKIGLGQRKGKINIEFASIEDLNRILTVLAPDVDGFDPESSQPSA